MLNHDKHFPRSNSPSIFAGNEIFIILSHKTKKPPSTLRRERFRYIIIKRVGLLTCQVLRDSRRITDVLLAVSVVVGVDRQAVSLAFGKLFCYVGTVTNIY